MVINFDKRECQTLCEDEIRRQQGLASTSVDYDFRNLVVESANESALVDASGQDKYTTEVVVSTFRGELSLLDGRADGTDVAEAAPDAGWDSSAASEVGSEAPVDFNDEIPF